ncbi:Protein ZINC INDUCED FACILITATOR 1 [Smittium mucronatum]|uniref:Protein ZINC INDUCED FACILITATOR 1 n=1 Tax=Smittium mucronatum TaxID=133383 RepID=A0A1R0GZC0_9FUNG|nr:Protein ZINC INDUCED FACILITATOR 1 [Smittium mucronatum]
MAWLAVEYRIFSGMVNGNVSVVKSVMGEISDPTNRARMFAFIPLCWNVGLIAGTLIGGFLYDPVQQFSNFNSVTDQAQSKSTSSSCHSSSTTIDLIKSCTNPNSHVLPSNARSNLESISQSPKRKVSYARDNLDESSFLLDPIESPNLQSSEDDRSFKSKFTPTMVAVLITNTTTVLAHSMFENFFSVWVAADLTTGGLEFSTEDISLALGISGLLHPWTDIDYTHIITFATYIHPG